MSETRTEAHGPSGRTDLGIALAATVVLIVGVTSEAGLMSSDALRRDEIGAGRLAASRAAAIIAVDLESPHDPSAALDAPEPLTTSAEVATRDRSRGRPVPSTELEARRLRAETGASADGRDDLVEDPAEEGLGRAEMLVFDFDHLIDSLGLELIDAEVVDEDTGTVSCFDGSWLLAELTLADFLPTTSALLDPTAAPGTGPLTGIDVLMDVSNGPESPPFAAVPTPGTLALVGLGLAGALLRRRRGPGG